MAANDSSTLRELLRVLVRHLGILEKSEAGCCGVSLAQCHAIVEIGRRGTINLNDLADLLDVDKSTMSRTINNLVESGMAARDLDRGDRRYVVIRLTENGHRFFESTEASMERYFQTVLGRIPQDKREQVLESLSLLTAALHHEKCC